jgi:phosphoribosylglycinamide formyltransferase-1
LSTEGKPSRLRLAVLASGRGSNLQSLLDAGEQADFPAEVVAVISDNADAQALERARKAGVDARWVDPGEGDYKDRLCREVESAQPGLICCAGYMRILPSAFVRRFPGKIINIHPSLLPSFPGLHAQRKALRAGVRISGCTVHFIDEGVDTGPIILQASVAVMPEDNEKSLSQRILEFEHRLYPLAVRLIAEGKVRLEGNRVHFADNMASEIPDGFIFPQPMPL